MGMKFHKNPNTYIGKVFLYSPLQEYRLITGWGQSIASTNLFCVDPNGGTFGIVATYQARG
jgi:hypothetical protein